MENEIGIAGWLYKGHIRREKTLTLLQLPAECASHGVKVVELCSLFFESQEASYINKLRAAAEDSGVSVRNIAVDVGNIAGADPKVRRTDIEALKQWFYTASAIGSGAIRINTGHADDDGAVARVIEGYQELAEVGERAGVKLLIENHGGLSARSDGLTRIVEGVLSESFATCPDTGNFMADDWEAGMRVLAPRAFSCHVKLFTYGKNGAQAVTDGTGVEYQFSLRRGLEILRDAGYTGPLCIEKGISSEETSWADMIRNASRYIQDLMADL